MSTPALASGHRCPGCAGVHAQRRTARNLLERAAVAVAGYHPYRCLDCGRRFHDRPLQRPPARMTGAVPRNGAARPMVRKPAAGLALTAKGGGAPRSRRRPRFAVDPGNAPLARGEIYVLLLIATLVALAVLVTLRFLWPVSPGGVRILD